MAQANQREKEIKLSQIGLIIVGGKQSIINIYFYFTSPIFPPSVFIVCHSMKWVPNIYELYQSESGDSDLEFYWPQWIREIEISRSFDLTLCLRADEQSVKLPDVSQLLAHRLHLLHQARQVCDEPPPVLPSPPDTAP